jgi:lysophospholipase L1-like esterase
MAGVLAVAAVVLFAPTAQADNPTGPQLVPPKDNYLALGDSLAFGYQQVKFNANFPTENPAVYNTGYVDDFSAALAPLADGGVHTVNLGCPGETTDSFLGLNGAVCGYHQVFALHESYTGSQEGAALAFLQAHPHQTSPITIDIGANDVLATVSACNVNPVPSFAVCVATHIPATITQIQNNLATILGDIQAVVPKTEVIVVGLYNPNVVDPRIPPAASDALAAQINAGMAATADEFGARFADPLPVFNPGPPGSAAEFAAICSLTFICGSLHDIHATDAGYQALANVIFDASGYSRLAE